MKRVNSLKKVMIIALIGFSGLVQADAKDIKELIAIFGSYDQILLNTDQLTESEQNILRNFQVELELKRLDNINANLDLLSEQSYQHEKSKSNRQFEVDNDPATILLRRRIQQEADQAKAALLIDPPKSIIDTIEFDPSLPQEMLINVYPGFPGAISFFDSTGAPWPISKVKLGAKSLFEAKESTNNIYSLEALQPNAQHAGWFVLDGLDTTIPFRISSTNTDFFNFRMKVIIPLIGPNAKPAKFMTKGSISVSKLGPEALAFLNGTASGTNGKELALKGVPGRAFLLDDHVYIRTTVGFQGQVLQHGALGDVHLYKTFRRAWYWFSVNGQQVKGYVEYDS